MNVLNHSVNGGPNKNNIMLRAMALSDIYQHREYNGPLPNSGFRGRRYEIVLSELPSPCNAGQVLDLGCGTGGLLSLLQESGYLALGFDVNRNAVETCQSAGLDASHLDLDQAESIPVKADTIICLETIEHCFDTHHILRIINEAMPVGGLFVLSCPNLTRFDNCLSLLKGEVPKAHPLHVRYFTKKSIHKICQEQGFELRHDLSFSRFTNRPLRNGLLSRFFATSLILSFNKVRAAKYKNLEPVMAKMWG